jgi:hypothetical protein
MDFLLIGGLQHTARTRMEMERAETDFIARLGMDNLFVVFYTHPQFKSTYDCLYEANHFKQTHRQLIKDALHEFATRDEKTGEYILEHFGTNIKITRPLHASVIIDTHFNIEGKHGNYHIYTNRAGCRIIRITYMVQTAFPF